MVQGRPPFWPPPMKAWLDERVPRFQATRDSVDLDGWYTEYQRSFPDYFADAAQKGESAKVLTDKFKQYFRNRPRAKEPKLRKTKALSVSDHDDTPAAPSATPSPTILPFLNRSKSVTGQSIFNASIRNEANLQVTADRQASGLDNKAHLGMLSRLLKTRWDELSDAERKTYEDRALMLNSSAPDPVFANQDAFIREGEDALRRLLGQGPSQLGHGVLCLLYGVRGENERLHIGAYDVSPYEDHRPVFAEVHPDFAELLKIWKSYCKKTVPRNHAVADPPPPPPPPPPPSLMTTFTVNNEGCPAWPENWSESNSSTLKQILHDFVVLQWRLAFSPRPAPTAPWGNAAGALTADACACLQPDIILRNPLHADSKPSYCSMLAEAFDTCCSSSPYFRLFTPRVPDPISSGEDAVSHDIMDDLNPTALDLYEEFPRSGLSGGGDNEGNDEGNSEGDHGDDGDHGDAGDASAPTDALQTEGSPQEESGIPATEHITSTITPRSKSPVLVDSSSGATTQMSPPRSTIIGVSSGAPSLQGKSITPPTILSGVSETTRQQSMPHVPFPHSTIAVELQQPAGAARATCGPTGRRDYSLRKKRVGTTLPLPAVEISCKAPPSAAGRGRRREADSIIGFKRSAGDEPSSADKPRGKRQRPVESTVKRSVRLQEQAASLSATSTVVSPPSTEASNGGPATRGRGGRRGRGEGRGRASKRDSHPAGGVADDETVVTKRGKTVKKSSKFWVFVPVPPE